MRALVRRHPPDVLSNGNAQHRQSTQILLSYSPPILPSLFLEIIQINPWPTPAVSVQLVGTFPNQANAESIEDVVARFAKAPLPKGWPVQLKIACNTDGTSGPPAADGGGGGGGGGGSAKKKASTRGKSAGSVRGKVRECNPPCCSSVACRYDHTGCVR